MIGIIASVGVNGKNHRNDVLVVQTLLKAKAYPPGPIDGVCGDATIGAICKFQAGFMPYPDGLVEPGRPTWMRLCAVGGHAPVPARLLEWQGDSALWPAEKKLRSLHPRLRPKIVAVLAALKKRGFQPKIFYGWRSVAVQLQLFQRGNTKVKFSFHNAQKPDGTPCSYAADIVDSRFGWDAMAQSSGFWKALGEEAKKERLYWGGDWAGFRDWAHVQLVENSELGRIKKESGL